MSEKTAEDRHRERLDEFQATLIREGISLAVMLIVLLAMSPRVQLWVGEQKQRMRRRQTHRQAHEAAMIAQLRRELSRDLPLVERGLVDP